MNGSAGERAKLESKAFARFSNSHFGIYDWVGRVAPSRAMAALFAFLKKSQSARHGVTCPTQGPVAGSTTGELARRRVRCDGMLKS